MTFAIEIPEWLQLDAGSHTPDANGVCQLCVEEVLAVLVDQGVTDAPNCVHPIFRDLSIKANDSESIQAKRTALMPDGIRSRGTAECEEDITTKLAVFVCRYAADRMPADTDQRVTAALRAAGDCLENPTDETRAEAAEAAWAARAAFYADLLTALLDEYDRLTGRTPDQYRVPTDEEWARVARVLGVAA